MSKNNYSDTTIVIPTLNEERNIGELLNILVYLYKGISVIVADDGSRDKTKEIVNSYHKKNKKIMLLDRSKERIHGLTASVVDAAKKVKTEYIVVMDGDLQHPPDKVRNIVERLRQKNDIIIGVRKKANFGSFFRKIMSKSAILFGQLRLIIQGVIVKDVVSGFFGVKTSLFQNKIKKYEKRFEKEGYKVLFDLLKLVNRRTRIKNVYYSFADRKQGSSKINKKHVMIYFRSLFK